MTWQIVRIGDLGRVVTGDTPPKGKLELYGAAFPFIKPTDMKVGQRYTVSWEENYSEEAYEKYRNKLIPEGSTAVVTIGSIGQKLTFTHTPCFVNQAVNAVIPDRKRFDPKYVYYLLKHNLHLVKRADTGASSGRENVSKSNFSSLEVYATLDLSEQERMAGALDSLDSAIENNQRRIALLEELARQLYREWFVQLNFPGAESRVRRAGIPPGWAQGSVKELASLVTRGITPNYDDSASGIVINQKPD
jgi:type I restriction enzyme S subunit